jgi:hypothetical protein
MDSADAMALIIAARATPEEMEGDQMTRHLHSLSIDVEVASLTMALTVALALDAIGCAFPITYVKNDLDR